MMSMADKEISWDLTGIFTSPNDPLIQTSIQDLTKVAEDFSNKYRGKISSETAEQLLKTIQEYESFRTRLDEVTLYSDLTFSANMTLSETQTLYDKVSKAEATLNKEIVFFEIETGNYLKQNPQLITHSTLKTYKHALERFKRQAAHRLSEIEEKLVIEKDQFGVRGWQQLQSKWLNTRIFQIEVEGKTKTLSYGEANGLLAHPDRKTRESANKSIYKLLGKDGELFSSALRNICNDWLSVCERRGYESPMHASLIDNDIDQQTIDNLLKAMENHVQLYRRYLRLKAKLMHLPKLENHDIVAPLPDAPRLTYAYETARDLVTEAYTEFDEDYAHAVKEMFLKKHIDASPRFGKRNGAWCAGWYKGKSAYILSSFNGNLSDIFTLAHELGHATHDYYSETRQTIMNTNIAMIVAETASTFGELLLVDLLLKKAQTNQEKSAIICFVLDEAGMAGFQVTARVWFEQHLYDAVKQGQFLDYETICRYWIQSRDRIYGDTVEWLSEMESEWTMKPHYYLPNFRFYNYPYVYAQMFVYALYQKYLEEGKDFVPKFKAMLSAGSSISPVDIGKIAGFDVTRTDFWDLGMRQFERLLIMLEETSGRKSVS